MAAFPDKKDFSQGSVLSCILRVAGPMTLALIINTLYNVVDRMYIGHIEGTGRLALTGLGLVFPITTAISAFQALISSGGSPLFAIARGEGNACRAETILGNAYAMLLLLGFTLTALGYLVKGPVLWAIGADASTFTYADDYLSVYLLGTAFVLTSVGMNPFINAQGYAKTGMLTVLLGAVTNLALDPLFIFVFGMGVRGAALASVLAQFLSAIWVYLFLTHRRTLIRLRLSAMRLDLRLIGRMLSLGVTGFTANVTSSLVSMLYNAQLAALGGTIWVSAMTVVNSLREIASMPFSGVANGAQPVISYNYGARRPDRVREAIRIMTLICILCTAAAWAPMMMAPAFFIRIFNDDPALLPIASRSIRLYFMFFPFMAFQMAGQTVFTALGRAKAAVFFSLLRKAILVIPLALILPHLWGLGPSGVLLSEPVSDVVGGLSCYITMRLTVFRKLGLERNP
ncbi:MAG: MATE family efflux transporter [Clostridiaceae bacterium]|nr:MATE family efflux transporter [Clostridiaceae bacterium]